MALVLCPECGEETVDQLGNCPLCNGPLGTDRASEQPKNGRLFCFGLAFVGGLGAATLCNMLGHTALAMGLGVVGLVGMVALMFSLFAAR